MDWYGSYAVIQCFTSSEITTKLKFSYAHDFKALEYINMAMNTSMVKLYENVQKEVEEYKIPSVFL